VVRLKKVRFEVMEQDQPLPKKKKIISEVEKAEEEPKDLVVKKGPDTKDDKEPSQKPIIHKRPKSPLVRDDDSDSDYRGESEDDEDVGDDNEEEEEQPERVDKETDRKYDDKLVGEKIRGNYDNGWHTGTIQYFNTEFMEYRVLFEDGSEDYISTDDIDGVDIILVPSEKFKAHDQSTNNVKATKKPKDKSPLEPGSSSKDHEDESNESENEEGEEEESEGEDEDDDKPPAKKTEKGGKKSNTED